MHSRDSLEPLGEIRQRAGKRVLGFAVEGDLDVQTIKSNTFESSGRREAERCRPFRKSTAPNGSICPSLMTKLLEGQRPFLDRLDERLGQSGISRA